MNTFNSRKGTQQRADEIAANASSLPVAENYCEDDLRNAESLEIRDGCLVFVFQNECFVIAPDGSKEFEITPFDLKKAFGTKRRLYTSHINEKLNEFFGGK
jgi:hypothetical protein